MTGQNTSPDWTDGQSNRELLDSLDAMGGAGADMGDQEVFRLLDEIESLSNQRAHAAELLEGGGMPAAPAEPHLDTPRKPASSTFFVNQAGGLSGLMSDHSDKPGNALSDTPLVSAPSSDLAKSPPVANTGQAFAGLPENAPLPAPAARSAEARPSPGFGSLSPDRMPASSPSPKPAAMPGRATEPEAPQMVESREIAAPERNYELGGKRKAAPEDFLPPDFFDPRDRKPKPRWGLWVTLAGIIIGMLLVAAFLIKKNYLDNRPRAQQGYGDLTKPAGR